MNKSPEHSPQASNNAKYLSLARGRSLTAKLKILLKVTITVVVLTLWSVVMLAIATVTLFSTRRIYNEYLAKWLAKFVLWQWNIVVITHGREKIPGGQVIYISNHSSTIDIFAIISLGLVRCRYFLFGAVRRVIPLGIIATLMGTFFTFPQTQPHKRTRLFKYADRTLRRTGESVYLSPEGTRITTGEIGHFNKGAFHLATSLKAPIVPFYISIPKHINPGTGINAEPGAIHIYFDDPVPTKDWKLQDLIENREKLRNLFLASHQKYGGR